MIILLIPFFLIASDTTPKKTHSIQEEWKNTPQSKIKTFAHSAKYSPVTSKAQANQIIEKGKELNDSSLIRYGRRKRYEQEGGNTAYTPWANKSRRLSQNRCDSNVLEKEVVKNFGGFWNNGEGSFEQFQVKINNKHKVTRPDGFKIANGKKIGIEHKNINPEAKKQTLNFTEQIQAQKKQYPGSVVIMTSNGRTSPVEGSITPKPSGPLAKNMDVMFYDHRDQGDWYKWKEKWIKTKDPK